MTEFKLTQGDLISPTWTKLKRHMEAQLQSLRIRNDSELDTVTTAKLRGEIRAYRNLLALSETTPATEADDE